MIRLYSIFDRPAGTFGAPFQAPNDALAVRSFEQAQLDTSHVFATHPADFEIHYLGEFDPNDASLNTMPKPTLVYRSSEVHQ